MWKLQVVIALDERLAGGFNVFLLKNPKALSRRICQGNPHTYRFLDPLGLDRKSILIAQSKDCDELN